MVLCDTFQLGVGDMFKPVATHSSLVLCDTFQPVAIRSSLVLCDTFQPVAIRSSLVLCDTFQPGIADTFQAWCCVICLSLLRYVSSLHGVVRYVSAWCW